MNQSDLRLNMKGFLPSTGFAVLLHHLDEAVEQICGIVRAGGSFGVILDRKDRQAAMPQPFDRVVVQIDVGHFAIAGKRIGINCKPMVLRSDFNTASGQVLDRVIAAVMAEWQLLGATAQGKAH